MPRGDKSRYTEKQKRQAEKIEEGYEERGVSEKEAGTPRLGHSEQDDRRRQETRRVGARKNHQQRPGQKRRQVGRRGQRRA